MAERILVVEDEKPIAEILKFNLEREGYEVVQAFNGQEALAVARQAHPDLVSWTDLRFAGNSATFP